VEEAFAKGMTFLAKLADDYPAVPEFRRELARALDRMGCLLFKTSRKAEAATSFRQARQLREQLTQDFPECPRYLLEWAWFLATCPEASIRDAKVALETAERVVTLAPEQADTWTTLGVAHYRNGNWDKAQAALLQAAKAQNGGRCAQWLFLAMTCQRLGNLGSARQWFDKAAAWMDQNQPIAEDLTRFQAEAEAVMIKGARSARLPIGVGGR
jgi:eukaryotic-like serine/threonine-protein kinase